MEQVPSRLSYVDLQGAITMLSGSFDFVARATPKVQFARVSPFDFVKMKVQRFVFDLDRTFSLCTFIE